MPKFTVLCLRTALWLEGNNHMTWVNGCATQKGQKAVAGVHWTAHCCNRVSKLDKQNNNSTSLLPTWHISDTQWLHLQNINSSSVGLNCVNNEVCCSIVFHLHRNKCSPPKLHVHNWVNLRKEMPGSYFSPIKKKKKKIFCRKNLKPFKDHYIFLHCDNYLKVN